jgi:hypothetical protein
MFVMFIDADGEATGEDEEGVLASVPRAKASSGSSALDALIATAQREGTEEF